MFVRKLAFQENPLRFHRSFLPCGLLLVVMMAGCSDNKQQSEQSESTRVSETNATNVADAANTADALVMQRWASSCALCHVNGVAGAPKTGDTDAWSSRMAQGKSVLLEHTVKGFNQMPPLGYCMSCESDDFIAMIEFMAGQKFGDLE